MKMSNKTYDTLKDVCLWLSALGALYFALSSIWGFPYGEQIVGTITAVVACITKLLKESSKRYRVTKQQDSFNSEDIVEMMDEEECDEDTDYAAEE